MDYAFIESCRVLDPDSLHDQCSVGTAQGLVLEEGASVDHIVVDHRVVGEVED